MKKPIVLTFVAHYLPGYKSGGPVRTIANMVDHLGDEFDFQIVTSDRDATDAERYRNISVDQWIRVGKAQVFYLSSKKRTFSGITDLIRNTEHDVMYINSFFNPVFTLLPLLSRWLCRIQAKPTVIAPRGEFSEGALSLKQWKKIPFLFIAKAIDLYRDLIWQASSKHEVQDIQKYMGKNAQHIEVAPDLPPAKLDRKAQRLRLMDEPLQIVFLSRITPKKNLDFALRVLEKVRTRVVFNIYGPVRDEEYWKNCQKIIKTFPSHIVARYHGPVFPVQVPGIMKNHDLFFLPTRGENYGHVIPEAMSAGTPVLIANTTPWRNLKSERVGWDLDLTNINAFVSCIEHCAAYSTEEYAVLRNRVMGYADRKLNDPELVEANRRLFNDFVKI
jgi:glycosyltransferase involved in cell wall biosynthesis